MGWNEPREAVNGGAGTTGQIEEANTRLDAMGVRKGPLALRVVDLVENMELYR
jgi:hypothetical protein